MKTAEIQVLTGLSDTLPASTDPNYQCAALCLMLRKTLEELDTQAFTFNAVESTDFSSFKTSLTNWLDDAYDRETEIIQDGVSEITANLPDILAIGAAYVSGGASEAIGCLINIALGRLLGGDSGAIAAYEAKENSVDLTDMIAKLEEIREQIEHILTEFSINTYNDPEGQSWTVGI